MNKHLILAAVLLVSTSFASIVSADDSSVPNTVILNKFPVLNADELKQVPFKTSIPDNYTAVGVRWEMHNPFRDKTIAGIVISIEYKTPSTDAPTVLELFIQVSCGPLQSADGHVGFFDAEQVKNASPTIKLKEIHYVPGQT